MRLLMGLAVGAVGLVICINLAQGQNPHATEAVTHAQAAVAQGKQGYPDALISGTRSAQAC
jgi:hypothetical protein